MRLRRRGRNRNAWLIGGAALAIAVLAVPAMPTVRRYFRMTRM